MKIRYIISLLGWLAVNPIFSQDEIDWMKSDKRIILDRVMNMEYSHPKGFLSDSRAIYCSAITGFIDLEGSLASEDRSFCVFHSIFNPVNEDDTLSVTYNGNAVDMGHINLVDNIVKDLSVKMRFGKDYIRYYPLYDAKTIFNADTVLSISFLLKFL